jgi:hypothetical protein
MRNILLTILLLMNSFLVGLNLSPQQTDPFANVPLSQQERLKSRLTQFVEYHRLKQWDKVYDLLAEQYKNTIEGGLPRDSFMKKRLYSNIRRFTPKFVQKAGEGWLMIEGCGTFDRGGGIVSLVEAYRQDGDWYFSDIWSVGLETNRSCKH